MSLVNIKIYKQEDNYVQNREPHNNTEFVKTIFCDVYRSKNVKIKKNINRIEYYYDSNFDEFYLIKFDNTQNINRKIRISHYKFYEILYKNLIKYV